MSMKNSNDTIGNRIRALPQPTAPLRGGAIIIFTRSGVASPDVLSFNPAPSRESRTKRFI